LLKDKLVIKDLHVKVGDVKILHGVNLEIPTGEIHAMMGPNGSGKSTLANALMGHPNYEVTKGEVYLGDVDILSLSPNERARQGLFLAFQYPLEIPGVRVQDFLRTSTMAVHPNGRSLAEFMDDVESSMETLKMDRSYLMRYLNDGFSGGEKKRAEVLQMMMLKPKIAIMDETDSGLDIDALQIVSDGVNSMRGENYSALIITHYQRILNYIKPDRVHILHKGIIALSGGVELAEQLEAEGYAMLKKKSTELAG
jgi:Fe-S cluster assembly ATP-binding protein